MMNVSTSLFSLLRLALGTTIEVQDLSALTKKEWESLIDLSYNQRVAALLVDGIDKATKTGKHNSLLNSDKLKYLKYELFSEVVNYEDIYQNNKRIIFKLAKFFQECGINMLLLKGYGLSLNYPIPSHRLVGDVDIYLYGQGALADKYIKEHFKCDVKQNGDKHSVFNIEGIPVENHAVFVNEKVHPRLKELNAFLIQEAEMGDIHSLGESQFMIPSATFNALFLSMHCATHFVHGEANISQLCDWTCFVQSHWKKVDWEIVKEKASNAGFFDFICCLNGIIHDCFGVLTTSLPNWPRNQKLEERILKEILAPKKFYKSIVGKVYRYFSSCWKYKIVYNDNMIISSFRLAKSYLRLKDKDAISIWKLNR